MEQALLAYLTDIGLTTLPIETRDGAGVRGQSAELPSAARPSHTDASTIVLTDAAEGLVQLRREIGECTRCKLAPGRTKLVFGEGNPRAALMFVGEAPGYDEDQQGLPFVGKAGQLLSRMIAAMGYRRDEVYIANVLKCRPPQNRNPEPDEVATCKPFLRRQIELVAPKVIVCLGTFAAQTILNTDKKIGMLRGSLRDWEGIAVMATYHPAFLLRSPEMKKPVWEDLKKVMEYLKK